MIFARRRKKKVMEVSRPVFREICRKHCIISFMIAVVFFATVIGIFSTQYLIHCREYAYDLSLDLGTKIYDLYVDTCFPDEPPEGEDYRRADPEAREKFYDVVCIDMLREAAYARSIDRIPFAFRILESDGDHPPVADSMQLTDDKFVETYRPDFTDVASNALRSYYYDKDYYRFKPEICEDVLNTYTEYQDEYLKLREENGLNEPVPLPDMDMEELIGVFSAWNSDEPEDIRIDLITEAYIDGSYLYPAFRLELNGEVLKSRSFFPADTEGMRYIEDIGWIGYYDRFSGFEIPDYVIRTLDDKSVYVSSFGYGLHERLYGDTLVYSLQIPSSGYYSDMCDIVFAFPCSFVKRYPVQVLVFAAVVFLIALLIAYISAKNSFKERNAEYELHKQRQEMTRAIAHDLKTPLTSLAGYSELLREKDVDPEKQKHYLEMIPKTVEQMNMIISEILEFSKVDANRMALTTEQIDLGELCREIVDDMKGTFDNADLKCEITIDEELMIEANRRLMHQALSNLIQNAAVHSKRGTTVRISSERRLLNVSLSITNVADKMPGLPIEELVKPFVKGSDHRGENSGSGVGLTVAKEDLELMGFRLEIVTEGNIFKAVCEIDREL